MLNRILFAIMGIALAVIGLGGAFEGGFYSTLYVKYISFGPFPRVVGVAVATIGGGFLFLAVKAPGHAAGDPDG